MGFSDEAFAEFMEHLRRAIHVISPDSAKPYTKESLAQPRAWGETRGRDHYQMFRILESLSSCLCCVCDNVLGSESCQHEGPGSCWARCDEVNPPTCALCSRPRIHGPHAHTWLDWSYKPPHSVVCPDCIVKVEEANPEPMETVWRHVEAGCFIEDKLGESDIAFGPLVRRSSKEGAAE